MTTRRGTLLGGYAPVFAVGGIKMLIVLGFFGQLVQAAAGPGLILITQQATGSLAQGGAVVAAFVIGAAVGRLAQGAVTDRTGPAPVLAASGAVHGAGMIGAALLGTSGSPAWAIAIAAAVGGLGLPPVSVNTRVVLARVLPDHRDQGYTLVTLAQESSFLFGSIMFGAITALDSAAAAVVSLTAVSALGALGVAALRITRETGAAPASSGQGGGLLMRAPLTIFAISALVGAAIGAIEVGVSAFAIEQGHRAATGLLFAAFSVGGLAGNLLLGSERWQKPTHRRLAWLLMGMTATSALLPFSGSLVVAAPLMLLCGIPFTRSLTDLALLIDDHRPPHAGATAFAWLSTTGALGSSAAAALAGVLAQHAGGSGAALVLAAVASAGATLAAISGRNYLAS